MEVLKTWVVPVPQVGEEATAAQHVSALYGLAPRWLIEKGAVWLPGPQIDVFDGAMVVPARPGDTIELVSDDTYGTLCRVIKAGDTPLDL